MDGWWVWTNDWQHYAVIWCRQKFVFARAFPKRVSPPNSIPLGASTSTSKLLRDSLCVFSLHVLKSPPAAISHSITASPYPVMAHVPARGLICHPLCLWLERIKDGAVLLQPAERRFIDFSVHHRFTLEKEYIYISCNGENSSNRWPLRDCVSVCVCAHAHLHTEYFLYQSNKQRINYLNCFSSFIALKMQQGTQPELGLGRRSITLLLLSQRWE